MKCPACGRKLYASATVCDCGRNLREAAGDDELRLRWREQHTSMTARGKQLLASGAFFLVVGLGGTIGSYSLAVEGHGAFFIIQWGAIVVGLGMLLVGMGVLSERPVEPPPKDKAGSGSSQSFDLNY